MFARSALLVIASTFGAAAAVGAQSPTAATPLPLPRTETSIADWDVAIARRAAAMLSSPDQWDRADSGPCHRNAAKTSVICALGIAIDDAARAGATSAAPQPDCRFTAGGATAEGSCGRFFDEATVFSVARAKAITSGVWRADASPREVWSGLMINAGQPVLQQARRLVDSIAPGKYRNARLVEFNNDSSVSFATLQAFFRSLEARLRTVTHNQLANAADSVEIELYSGGTGVMRTYNGWYALSGWAAHGSTIAFRVDTAKEIAPNALDREIVKRADALLSSDAVWNRADNRICPADATTWSIYCALVHATREVTGGFHHRRPALETVRVLVDERTKGRDYHHRLMDYNNDSTTTLADVHSLFAAALARMP